MSYIIYFRDPGVSASRGVVNIAEQKTRVANFLNNHPGTIIESFSEFEPHRIKTRAQFLKALEKAAEARATLIIPHLGLLNRNAEFLVCLKDANVPFFILDYPEITVATLPLLAAIAIHAREEISLQTKAKLQELKARGAKLGAALVGSNFTDEGRRKSAQVRRAVSRVHTDPARSLALDLRKQGSPLQYIAQELNSQGFRAARGGPWGAKQVSRLLAGAL